MGTLFAWKRYKKGALAPIHHNPLHSLPMQTSYILMSFGFDIDTKLHFGMDFLLAVVPPIAENWPQHEKGTYKYPSLRT